MANRHCSDIPYEPVEEDFSLEDAHFSRAEIWWRIHNNKILGWIVVFLVLVISYVLICSLPVFHKGAKIQRTTFPTMSMGVGNGKLPGIPPLTNKNEFADQDSMTNGNKTPAAGISNVSHLVETAKPKDSTSESDEPSNNIQINQTALNMPPSSMDKLASDNLISTARLPQVSSGNIDHDTAFQMSANRSLPSNATDYDAITLLAYMKLKAIFSEFHCPTTNNKYFPVFKFNVTVSDHTYTGQEQNDQKNAKLAAARLATEDLFGIHYREPLPSNGNICH